MQKLKNLQSLLISRTLTLIYSGKKKLPEKKGMKAYLNLSTSDQATMFYDT